MDEQKGPWETVADQALEYLIVTRNIAAWLAEIDPELQQEPEDDPDYSELEQMLADRQAAVDALRAVDSSLLSVGPITDRERTSQEIAQDLFRKIAGLEEENQLIMDGLGRKYREKIKHLRQSREQLETYGKQQLYGEGLPPDMLAGARFNQAN